METGINSNKRDDIKNPKNLNIEDKIIFYLVLIYKNIHIRLIKKLATENIDICIHGNFRLKKFITFRSNLNT